MKSYKYDEEDHIVEDKLYIDVVPVWKWLLTDFV